jgi:hypothetical protein
MAGNTWLDGGVEKRSERAIELYLYHGPWDGSRGRARGYPTWYTISARSQKSTSENLVVASDTF